MLSELTPLKWKVDQYIQLSEKITDHTILLNGEILQMTPISIQHGDTQERIRDWLKDVLLKKGDKSTARNLGSVEWDEGSLCKPDVFIVKPEVDMCKQYFKGADLSLAVEIGKSTWAEDVKEGEGTKLAKFACAGIAEVWVINITNSTGYRYTCPKGTKYANREAITTLNFLGGNISIKQITQYHYNQKLGANRAV